MDVTDLIVLKSLYFSIISQDFDKISDSNEKNISAFSYVLRKN